MHQLARFAGGWDVVVPAARDVRFWIKAEGALAAGGAEVMIVEEPAVVARFAQGRLNCVQVHRRDSTLPALGFATWCGPDILALISLCARDRNLPVIRGRTNRVAFSGA